MTNGTVKCRVCGDEKDRGDFYAAHISETLAHGECKECTKERVRHRARTNPKVQEYDRARAKLPHVRERIAHVATRWNAANPDAYKAHYTLSNAVRDGKIARQPCLFCGEFKVHAHHRDYSKPLDVIWLCPKCHHRLHANFPETEGVNKVAAP